MPKRNYIQFLTNKDKLRIELITGRGKITKFIVQYYARINSVWRTVLRFDNCHGYPHKHVYYLHNKQYYVVLNNDNEHAFNESKRYIIANFAKIKENFLNQ